jgi:site-specific recombinase XerD
MTGNFPQLLHAFFHEWLAGQRNNSRHTVRSYRDTWRLFLRFMAAQEQRPVAALRLADLTASEVLAFLDHSEKERRVASGITNEWRPWVLMCSWIRSDSRYYPVNALPARRAGWDAAQGS